MTFKLLILGILSGMPNSITCMETQVTPQNILAECKASLADFIIECTCFSTTNPSTYPEPRILLAHHISTLPNGHQLRILECGNLLAKIVTTPHIMQEYKPAIIGYIQYISHDTVAKQRTHTSPLTSTMQFEQCATYPLIQWSLPDHSTLIHSLRSQWHNQPEKFEHYIRFLKILITNAFLNEINTPQFIEYDECIEHPMLIDTLLTKIIKEKEHYSDYIACLFPSGAYPEQGRLHFFSVHEKIK